MKEGHIVSRFLDSKQQRGMSQFDLSSYNNFTPIIFMFCSIHGQSTLEFDNVFFCLLQGTYIIRTPAMTSLLIKTTV